MKSSRSKPKTFNELQDQALKNPEAFFESSLKLRHRESSKLVRVKLRYPQKRLLTKIAETKAQTQGRCRLILLKGRRWGGSTVCQGLGLAQTLFREGRVGRVVAHRIDSAIGIFGLFSTFYEALIEKYPEYIDELRVESGQGPRSTDWRFGNGSRFAVMTAGSREIGKGDETHFLHLSEVAMYRHADEIVNDALLPTVPKAEDTYVIVESTAKGVGNWFHEKWQEAEVNEKRVAEYGQTWSDWRAIFVPWYEDPDYRLDMPLDIPLPLPDAAIKDFLEEEERIRRLYQLDDRQLAWRRSVITTECEGRLSQFRQNWPCVTGDTRIGTDKGILRADDAISEATEGTLGKIKSSRQENPSRVYRITTGMGYTFRGTEDHPVFLSSGLVLPISLLTPGQKISLQPPRFANDYYQLSWDHLGIRHSITIDEDWGCFLGFFVADGSIDGRGNLSIVFDQKDQDSIAEMRRLFKSLFDLVPHERVPGGSKALQLRICRREFRTLFEHLGLTRRRSSDQAVKRRVRVPEAIWRSPRPVIRAFLRGYFDGDGFAGYRNPRIMIGSKEAEMIHDVQLLLLGFAITGKASYDLERRNGNRRNYVTNELNLRADESRAFRDRIGFVSSRKQDQAEAWIVNPKTGRRARPMILEDVVTSIVEDGYEPTFDFAIASAHAYDTNGIRSHNCDPEEAFLHSSPTVFDRDYLKELYYAARAAPPRPGQILFVKGKYKFEVGEGNLEVTSLPTPTRHYLIAADASESLSEQSDFSAAVVFYLEDGIIHEAANYMDRTNPIQFALDLRELGIFYNNAMICPENAAGPNMALIRALQNEANYARLWTNENFSVIGRKQTERIGWPMTSATKVQTVHELANLLSEREIVFYSERVIEQLRDFAEITSPAGRKTYGHASKYGHDDLAMAAAIGAAAMVTRPPSPVRPKSKRRDDFISNYEKNPEYDLYDDLLDVGL